MKVFVAGGTGFIGRHLCMFLVAEGHNVTAASRSPNDALDGVETVSVDITRDDLTEAVRGHDVVVNLVALPSHVQPRRRTHRSVHMRGTERLLEASEDVGVDRFVQMSGLRTDSDVKTAYFEAKRRAEEVVRGSKVKTVIYRPSVVFGDGCAFVPFVRRITPPFVAFVPGARTTRMQPIWVEDLVPMVAEGVVGERHVGETYEIGGPEKLTLGEIVKTISDVPVIHVPDFIAAVGFAVLGFVPFVPFGMDQYRVLGIDNTVEENDAAVFGFSSDRMLSLDEYIEDEP